MAISCNRLRFRRGIPVIHHCTARFPRRFAPRNDKPVCPAPMNLCCKTYSLQGAQGTPLQTQSVHTVLSTPCTNCKCSAGSGMPFPATRHEGLASNENIRLTAAHLMLYTDTGGPQPVRLQENPPSQKFRREEKCERKPSGCPFAFNNPPQRQNCKIMIQKLILQFGKQLGEKAQRDFFDKLTQRKRSGLRVQKASQSSPPAGGEKSEIIFSGGVYVGENTAQPASVRIARL